MARLLGCDAELTCTRVPTFQDRKSRQKDPAQRWYPTGSPNDPQDNRAHYFQFLFLERFLRSIFDKCRTFSLSFIRISVIN